MSSKKPGLAIMLGIGKPKKGEDDEEELDEGMTDEIAAEVYKALKSDDEEGFKENLISLIHSCGME